MNLNSREASLFKAKHFLLLWQILDLWKSNRKYLSFFNKNMFFKLDICLSSYYIALYYYYLNCRNTLSWKGLHDARHWTTKNKSLVTIFTEGICQIKVLSNTALLLGMRHLLIVSVFCCWQKEGQSRAYLIAQELMSSEKVWVHCHNLSVALLNLKLCNPPFNTGLMAINKSLSLSPDTWRCSSCYVR